MSEQTPMWRQDFEHALARLPADTPDWAKAMMDLTLTLAVAQINHTDANTRMALAEQDDRIDERIGKVENALTTVANLHDNAFTVMETLLEQNAEATKQNTAATELNAEAVNALTRRVLWLTWLVVGFALLLLGVTVILLGRDVLLPSDLVWLGEGAVVFVAVWLAFWFWNRGPTRGNGKGDV